MNCPRCGNKNRAEAGFCGYCGMSMTAFTRTKLSPGAAVMQLFEALGLGECAPPNCARCGKPNRSAAKFCGYCGSPVSGGLAISKPGLAAALVLALGAVIWASNIMFNMFNRGPALAASPGAAATSRPGERDRPNHAGAAAAVEEALINAGNWQKALTDRYGADFRFTPGANPLQFNPRAGAPQSTPRAYTPQFDSRVYAPQLNRVVYAPQVNRGAYAPQTGQQAPGTQLNGAHEAAQQKINSARDDAARAIGQHR